ncbi:MAG: hypothetical protein J6Y78_03130 [Paludibacteraceae bacterium]|nr:hypothetical protein [Methanobrevibacter sp.]MBP5421416.1 hypothetical protein [Paludibacteraceae bacterium]
MKNKYEIWWYFGDGEGYQHGESRFTNKKEAIKVAKWIYDNQGEDGPIMNIRVIKTDDCGEYIDKVAEFGDLK